MLKGVGSPAATAAVSSGTCSHRSPGRRAFSTDDPPSTVLFSVVNGGRHRVRGQGRRRDPRAVARPDGNPLRSYVTGQAGFDADRSAAVEGIDGTAAGDHRRARAAADAVDLPLAADRGADARRGGDRVRDRHRDIYGLVQADVTTVSGQSTAILIVLDVRRGHRLLPADRLALPRRAARERRRRRCAPRRAGDPRLGRDRRRVDADPRRSPTTTRRARWARSWRSGSS